MDQYADYVAGYYQAPYYGSGPWDPDTGPFEPAGDSTQDGSNLPDYVTFCMDRHQYEQSDLERGGVTVKAIQWGPPWCTSYNADKHGAHASGDIYNGAGGYEQEELRTPYNDTNKENCYNYVLSCTDCHEPHGSPYRLHLIRRFVNGEDVNGETQPDGCNSDDDYQQLCGRCHTNMHDLGGCFVCHSHGKEMNFGAGLTRLF